MDQKIKKCADRQILVQINRQIGRVRNVQKERERERNIERKKVIIDRWMDPQSERMLDRQIDGQID